MGESSAAKYRPELDLDEFERRLRAAAPTPQARQPAQGASDPLAELARLVGGAGEGGRQDPFEALFRAQKAVSEGRPAPIAAPHEPYFDQHAAPAAGDPQGYAEDHPHWAEVGASQAAYGETGHAQGVFDEGAYGAGAYGEGAWAHDRHAGPEFAPQADGMASQMRDQAARGGKRKVVYAMAALLVGGVAVFAGGLAMKKGSTNGEVVTIQADSDPARIKPAAQENAGSGSGQALFDHKDDNAPAKVVSNAEQPADLAVAAKQAKAQAATAARQAQDSAASVPTPPPPAPVSTAAAQGNEGVLMAPKKVKTISVRADGSLLNGPEAPPRSTLPSMVTGFPDAGPMLPMAGARPAAPRAAAPSATEAALHAPKPKSPAEKHAEPVANEPAGAGEWAVQLSSAPSEAEARSSASRYASKYGAELQGRHPTFVSAKLGDRTVYRVRIGRLSKDSAESMCSAIKGHGGGCFVTRN